jgi:hypothetical protein
MGLPAAMAAPALMTGHGRAKRDTAASITKSEWLSLAEVAPEVYVGRAHPLGGRVDTLGVAVEEAGY